MPRQKQYIEEEVIEKAMELFWRNGYEATSVRMLEKEMGINQFSMYSSFGSKHGVFLESIKLYAKKANLLVDKLEKASNGIEDIKQFFYDFIELSRKNDLKRGCLMVNTLTELGDKTDDLLLSEMLEFSKRRDAAFKQKLHLGSNRDEETISKQTNFLSITAGGLAVALMISDKKQLHDFVETTIENL